MTQLFMNNATALLALPVGMNDTHMVMVSGTGAAFRDIVDSDDFYLVTIENWNTGDFEICKVINKNGDDLTVVREQEGTVAQNWAVNSVIDHRLTAGTIDTFLPVTNSEFTVEIINDETIIKTPIYFAKRSTQLYVGGLRQSLGLDYTEIAPNELKLLYPLSLTEISSGQNIVLDFIRRY